MNYYEWALGLTVVGGFIIIGLVSLLYDPEVKTES